MQRICSIKNRDEQSEIIVFDIEESVYIIYCVLIKSYSTTTLHSVLKLKYNYYRPTHVYIIITHFIYSTARARIKHFNIMDVFGRRSSINNARDTYVWLPLTHVMKSLSIILYAALRQFAVIKFSVCAINIKRKLILYPTTMSAGWIATKRSGQLSTQNSIFLTLNFFYKIQHS